MKNLAYSLFDCCCVLLEKEEEEEKMKKKGSRGERLSGFNSI